MAESAPKANPEIKAGPMLRVLLGGEVGQDEAEAGLVESYIWKQRELFFLQDELKARLAKGKDVAAELDETNRRIGENRERLQEVLSELKRAKLEERLAAVFANDKEVKPPTNEEIALRERQKDEMVKEWLKGLEIAKQAEKALQKRQLQERNAADRRIQQLAREISGVDTTKGRGKSDGYRRDAQRKQRWQAHNHKARKARREGWHKW